jgi:hypothetical protein
MAHEPTGTKAVEIEESLKQLNVLIPHEKLETLHRLKAVCGVNLTGLVKACIDLFNLAHEAETQGGKVVIVSADGTERLEVQLPRGNVRTRSVKPGPGEETEAPPRL